VWEKESLNFSHWSLLLFTSSGSSVIFARVYQHILCRFGKSYRIDIWTPWTVYWMLFGIPFGPGFTGPYYHGINEMEKTDLHSIKQRPTIAGHTFHLTRTLTGRNSPIVHATIKLIHIYTDTRDYLADGAK
jgi:hypothetical protein